MKPYKLVCMLFLAAMLITGCSITRTVVVKSQPTTATVFVNEKPKGSPPVTEKLTWKERKDFHNIEVRLEGYETSKQALTFEEAKAKSKAEPWVIEMNLKPKKFVQSVIRRWALTTKGVELEEEIALSQVGEIEREPKVQSVTKITDAKPDDSFMESRISTLPNGQGIVYSFPYRLPDKSAYANLWSQLGGGRTRLTDAAHFDIEPAVSPDGEWIYFASTRLGSGKVNIWRMRSQGRGGLTKITDSPSAKYDSDPSISPDGQRIAYSSLLVGSEIWQIWTANADGTLPTQIRQGRYPQWSPDGSKILFVAGDSKGQSKIWVMSADGGNPTQLTSGDQRDEYPVWSPDGKRIIFASNQTYNEVNERNFDIWMMNADGTGKTQLTVNGSYDSRPAISKDGKYIYFVSNRGARRENEESLQVWRIELPSE